MTHNTLFNAHKRFTKTLLAVSLCAAVASPSAFAKETNIEATQKPTPQYMGVGSGLVVGALVGGPIGAIVGSVFGAMVVDDHNKDEALAMFKAKNAEQAQLIAQQHTLLNDQTQNSGYIQASQQQTVVPVVPEMMTDIQFLSGSSALEPHYHVQLDLLADKLAQHQDWLVTLQGFADIRGSQQDNLALSEARALSVKHYLMTALNERGADIGDKGRIITQIMGEIAKEESETSHHEKLFFDRKVTISVQPVSEALVAAK